ncbi:MAG: hypothetical protein Q7S17_04980 [Xanthobacteraceae bacterium]|nr:hypothetical protein [Xanthobacteraceae bacterium]
MPTGFRSVAIDGLCRRLQRLAGAGLILLAVPAELAAQNSLPFSGPGGTVFAPPPVLTPPPATAPAAPRTTAQVTREPHATIPAVASGKVALALSARFAADGPYIPRALHWRVFAAKGEAAGPLTLAAEAAEAYPVFALPPGDYVVIAAYGLASATARVSLQGEGKRETLIVPGGGLRLQGRVGETAIPAHKLKFDVFEGSFLQRAGTAGARARASRADRPPVVRNASAGDLVLLPAGIYYIQSVYGEGNAVIQADVRIEPGRLTDATVQHRAAQITLKLVNNSGGEAIANTAWSVLTPGGDSIKESIGAFPSVVLAEGEYVAVARHDGKIYQQNFKCLAGNDREIEVLAR